jgi:hypothetical protein
MGTNDPSKDSPEPKPSYKEQTIGIIKQTFTAQANSFIK